MSPGRVWSGREGRVELAEYMAFTEQYTIINDLAARGKGVVMISSEMPELLGMCDRIYVMNEGALVGELTAAEASQERIMSLIVNEQEELSYGTR